MQSRLDDLFTYPGDLVVHPLVFASVLGRDRGVDRPDRQATGKVRRFVPLEAAAVARPG